MIKTYGGMGNIRSMNAILLGAVVAVLLILLVLLYNKMVTLQNKVKEALSTMDVYLKKRFDLVPELVAVVKGYANHESATLEGLTQKRAGTLSARLNCETQISEQLTRILVCVEAYPELKANSNFLDLQKQLMQIEEDIAASRRYYNGSVREFNNACQTIPANLVAYAMGFKTYPMFEAKAEERNLAELDI